MTETWIAFTPCALYGLAAGAAALDLRRGGRPLRIMTLVLVALALLARIAVLLQPGLCPLSKAGSGLGIVALFLALHVCFGFRMDGSARVRTLLLLGLIVLADCVGLLLPGGESRPAVPHTQERVLGEIHGGLTLLAYAAFVVGAVYSLLYLLLYRIIRRRRLGFWFSRLPSLWRLEAGSKIANLVGLIALTLGLGIGIHSLAMFQGGIPLEDPKVLGALLVWLLFACEKASRWFLRWTGVRIMWVPLAGIAIIVIVMLCVGEGRTAHPFWSP